MTAAAILALCEGHGVRLEVHGDGFRVRGPKAALAELKALVLEHKVEVLDLLKRPALPGTAGTTTTTRQPLPPDGPRERWAYDWRGKPVNLFGLRPGEDGRPPVFLLPKPEGRQ